MICKALIVGCEHVKGISTKSGKPFDFHKVNFLDTENPSGSAQSMTLADNPELQNNIAAFEAARMKTCTFNVFQNGNFTNFGGFIK